MSDERLDSAAAPSAELSPAPGRPAGPAAEPVAPPPSGGERQGRSTLTKILVSLAVVAALGAAFLIGVRYGKSTASPFGGGPGGTVVASQGAIAAPGGSTVMGGPIELTEEEQAALQNMTEEERQAFFEEKLGEPIPGGPGQGPMMARGGVLTGEVVEVSGDTITLALEGGGSQTVYTDADTIVAFVKGAGDLAAGSKVLVEAVPEADGVTTATLVVVTE